MNAKIGKRAIKELKSAFPLYFTSTLVISACLAIFSFFALLYINLQHFTNYLAQELVLNVYLNPGTKEKDAQEIIDFLLKEPNITEVKLLSPQKVLKDLANMFEEKDLIAGVSPKFLPPVLEVAFKNPFRAFPQLPSLAKKLRPYPQVMKVQYAKSWLERLAKFKNFLEILSLTGLFLLGGATAFIAGSTVRLSLVPKSKELEILSLVGATPSFIQGPLLLLAFIQALLAFGLAISLVWIFYFYLSQSLSGIFPRLQVELIFLNVKEIIILLGGVLLLCLSGCYWASRRFLRY